MTISPEWERWPRRRLARTFVFCALPAVLVGVALLGLGTVALEKARSAPAAPAASTELTFPLRGIFVYQWFPETWTVNGAHVFYHPTLDYYDSSSQSVTDAHIRALDYGKFDVAITSWWGPGTHQESTRIPLALSRTTALGLPLRWTAYYEREGTADPTVTEIQNDLAYLSVYASDPAWARIGGKPVIFVYSANDSSCAVADRWAQAAAGWHVVLKIFTGWRTCPAQPQGWHQYAPAGRETRQFGYSFTISPGFWRADEASPRLARDPNAWRQDVAAMDASGEPWQLVTTFNEFGEGTAVEAAEEWISPSGYGTYLDALHEPPQPPPPPSDPVIAAAGDIACDPGNSSFRGGLGSSSSCHQKYTSDLLVNAGLSAVLPLGDNQYYCAGYQAFVQSYDSSWGRVKEISQPVVGNHEYLTTGGSAGSGGTDCNAANAGAAGHFRYFGAAAGDPAKGYYSFDIGTWHLIALNVECSRVGGCGPTSPQGTWLQADLAAHTNFCTLAYWHKPLFSSVGGSAASTSSKPFWDALYAADADVILAAHAHRYERFVPQTPAGAVDPVRGIREFIVGTGGANRVTITSIAANSEVRNDGTFGVLKLTLHPTSYDWQFVPEIGASFTDFGTAACHGNQTDTTPPTAPADLTATATAPNAIALSWSASTDNVGVSAYRIYRDGTEITTVTSTSHVDTGVQPSSTHTYTVFAVDTGGNVSSSSTPVSATTSADTQPPTAPGNLSASAGGAVQVNLSWTASTDDVRVAEYQVFRDGVSIGTSAMTSYLDSTVLAETTYTYTVGSRDAAGNFSAPSNSATVTTPPAPTTLTLTPTADAYVQSDQPTMNFGASSQLIVDASPTRRLLLKFTVSGVSGRPVLNAKLRLYCSNSSGVGGKFHRVGNSSWNESSVNWNNQPAADAATIASLGSVSTGTTYEVDVSSLVTGDGTYTIAADSTSSDSAQYLSKEGSSPPQLVVTVGTGGGGDTTPPSAPTNLAASARSGAVDLGWTASTDDVGVADYQVFRGGVAVGTSTTTSFTDTGLQAQTTYSYTVVARDGANNASAPSNTATATTPTSSILTFTPAADAYVQSDQPTVNFGASSQVVVDASPSRRLLLKFTVSGVNGRPVASAKLRLRCTDPSSLGGRFHRVANSSWGETSVNWNNQPAADAATIASLGSVSAGTTYEVDVSSLVTGDGTYTIGADSSSGDGAYYSSREGSSPPQLVVTLS